MKVSQAREIARRWVMDDARNLKGFRGAYFAGSVNVLPGDAPVPATSDLDINLVLDGQVPASRIKLVYQGVLLEANQLSMEQLRSPEQVLSHYHLAGGLRTPGIISDPSGELTKLQAIVGNRFAQRVWVLRRCEHAKRRVVEQLDTFDPSEPLHDQVIGWVFPTGVLAHVLLTAGLKNPTVRRRYLAVRELLVEHCRLDLYEMLLEALACAHMNRSRVERHLEWLADVFDAAAAVIRTRFPFSSDISEIARSIAIDGSRELIRQGYHREAVFWMLVTYSRCMKVLDRDAPTMERGHFDLGYRELLNDIGIMASADLRERVEHVRDLLPQVWRSAEAIMAANPEIED